LLQCIALCCSVLQCVAIACVVVEGRFHPYSPAFCWRCLYMLQYVAVCCNVLQCFTLTHTLQHTASRKCSVSHSHTPCNTLHHANAVFHTHTHTATHCIMQMAECCSVCLTAQHCNTLQRTATYCNILQKLQLAATCVTCNVSYCMDF